MSNRATEDLIASLRGERGAALQAAQCYRAQRDLACAEVEELKQHIEFLNGQQYD